ncbi:MAG: RdgB/HAM1 family non-canonical purine NTP pyrophosphatase [Bacteroidetes bacterium]|nr:RdgB/HAM1 family non-canonical purine NTP pyrophosphatase [Bacteroidota bacterium]
MELIFATNNKHKLEEIKKILPSHIVLLRLVDIGYTDDIEETGATFEANAAIKANTIFLKTGKPCFADDSGMAVDFLNGNPGVRSARYAGEPANDKNNVKLLLKELENVSNRNASFNTVICYRTEKTELFFEGEIKGTVADKPRGLYGFGYDPIFIPNGHDMTFAEMMLDQKNSMSHRKLAVEKLINYLTSL